MIKILSNPYDVATFLKPKKWKKKVLGAQWIVVSHRLFFIDCPSRPQTPFLGNVSGESLLYDGSLWAVCLIKIH